MNLYKLVVWSYVRYLLRYSCMCGILLRVLQLVLLTHNDSTEWKKLKYYLLVNYWTTLKGKTYDDSSHAIPEIVMLSARSNLSLLKGVNDIMGVCRWTCGIKDVIFLRNATMKDNIPPLWWREVKILWVHTCKIS